MRVYNVIGGGGGGGPVQPIGMTPSPTQDISYLTYDIGWLVANGYYSNVPISGRTSYHTLQNSGTLGENNIHGNTARYTDQSGTPDTISANGIIQDHYLNLDIIWKKSLVIGNVFDTGTGTVGADYGVSNRDLWANYAAHLYTGDAGSPILYDGTRNWRMLSYKDLETIWSYEYGVSSYAVGYNGYVWKAKNGVSGLFPYSTNANYRDVVSSNIYSSGSRVIIFRHTTFQVTTQTTISNSGWLWVCRIMVP